MVSPDTPDNPRTQNASHKGRHTAIFLAGVMLTTWCMLPTLAQHLLVPWLGARLETPGLGADIRRLDFSGLDLGNVTLGPGTNVRISAMQLDWSLTGLARGRLDAVRVLGLEILARHEGGSWQVAGLPLTGGSADSSPIPLQIDTLHVDGRITLESSLLNLCAPFTVTGALEKHGQAALNAHAAVAGHDVHVQLRADLPARHVRLSCALPPASMAALAGTVPALAGLGVGGGLQAQTEMTLMQGQPRGDVNLDLHQFHARLGETNLAQTGNTSLHLAIADTVNATLTPLRLDAPVPLTLIVRDPHFDPTSGHGGANWELIVENIPGLRFASAPRLTGETSVTPDATGWNIRTRAELDPMRIEREGQPGPKATLAATFLDMELSANATEQNFGADLKLGDLRLEHENLKTALTGLTLHANATRTPEDTRGALRLAGATLTARQASSRLTTNSLGGQCGWVWGPTPRLEGDLAFTATATAEAAVARIAMNLPLSWPTPEKTPGQLRIDFSHKSKAIGSVTASLRPKDSGLRLDGTLALTPLPVRGRITGQLVPRAPESSWIEVNIGQKLTFPGQLAGFAPVLGGLTGTARLDARIRLDAGQGQPSCPASLRLRDIELAHEGTTALTKANLSLNFPDLLTSRSDPEQRLGFQRLRLGSVLLDQGDIRFRVETPRSILVERCGFRWAGGRIGTQAFRVDPGVDDYTVELYCDRVQLAQALEQLGMRRAQGGGAANGRIPVRYAHGSISFDDGFLYSTPGEKGVLRIQGTDILTAGVPPGSIQYAQLDLAAEALKNFSYDWAKMSLDTKGQELVVSLQLDGKPEGPLPFVFNKDIGAFVRVTGPTAGSNFQGIRLDANFRLPLDQLLQHRQLLDLIKNGG
ncbi:MAG: hypothetical protein EOL86_10670 [Deltaproteobacteria bacterium]|nr:hypothetical protein [Deltaproteobacteria bacterium]